MAKTLAQKLYIREGYNIALVDAPQGYTSLLEKLPEGVTTATELKGTFDWVQCFALKRDELEAEIDQVKRALKDDALLWITYPKAKQRKTDLNRDILADIARRHGLRSVAQISVDDVWSALRFKVVD